MEQDIELFIELAELTMKVDKSHKYGRLRHDLLEHLIRHFIQQVKDYG